MSWIRIENSLPRNRKMVQLARELHCNRMTALGIAVTWLSWLDEQTVDGRTGMCCEEADDILGFKGAGSALVSIGWAELDEHGALVAVDWEQYNGESAKKRALSARRVARKRSSESNASSVTSALPTEDTTMLRESYAECNARSVTSALPREEKIREEYISPNKRLTKYTCDTSCEPHDAAHGTPTIDEVIDVMQSMNYANLKGDKLRDCAEKWLDTMRSSAWRDSKNRPVRDWAANARNWARGYAEADARGTARKPAGGVYTAPKNLNDAGEYGHR